MSWEVYQQMREWDDGMLHELHTLGTTMEDWHRFADFLKDSAYPLTFKHEEISDLSASLEEIFRRHADIHGVRTLLSIDVHGMILNCHFFIEEDIEMDLDPREVVGAEQWEQLKDFTLDMAEALQKEVILTPENSPQIPLFHFHPIERRVEVASKYLT